MAKTCRDRRSGKTAQEMDRSVGVLPVSVKHGLDLGCVEASVLVDGETVVDVELEFDGGFPVVVHNTHPQAGGSGEKDSLRITLSMAGMWTSIQQSGPFGPCLGLTTMAVVKSDDIGPGEGLVLAKTDGSLPPDADPRLAVESALSSREPAGEWRVLQPLQ